MFILAFRNADFRIVDIAFAPSEVMNACASAKIVTKNHPTILDIPRLSAMIEPFFICFSSAVKRIIVINAWLYLLFVLTVASSSIKKDGRNPIPDDNSLMVPFCETIELIFRRGLKRTYSKYDLKANYMI